MKTLSTLLIAIFLVNVINLYAQDDDCPIISIGVEKAEMTDAFLRKLVNDYPDKPATKDAWLSEIQAMVCEALKNNNPGVKFVRIGSGAGEAYEYVFKYLLSLSNIAEGDYDFEESIIDEYSKYYFEITSSINSVHPCGPSMFVYEHITNRSRTLRGAIESNIADHFSLENKIERFEKENPVPPRDPELSVELDRDFVSPLKEERIAKVKARVVSCREIPAYDVNPYQFVFYSPEESDRGSLDFKVDQGYIGMNSGPQPGVNTLVVYTIADGTAEAEFELESGVEQGNQTVTIKTCGLVSFFIEELETLKIKGLEVKVRPVRKEIYQEEETEIILTLNKTDPDGGDEPVSGKKLSVRITGLNNGEIKPKSNYVTDSRGEVRLHYKAGDRDEMIQVSASFQPEDYPDKATGRAFIKVKPPEYDAAITITRTTRKEFLDEKHESRTDRDGCTTQTDDIRRVDENINATIYVQCKLSQKADMPIFNQTWEYYQPMSVNISGFDLKHMETHQMNGSFSGAGCANGGYETTVTTNYIVKEPEIYEPLTGMWIVAIDNETSKAVKIVPGGYSIEYIRDAIIERESRRWDEKGQVSDNNKETKTTENLNYGVGPVEDPVPDPTFKPGLAGIWDYLKEEVGDSLVNAIPDIPIPPPSSEEVPEINPDLLVSYGDGIKSFGGSGSKEINEPRENGYERETHTYRWQMTRRKLNK
ncbi:MAG: hypothetical protein RQ743_03560 [Bacteroidales bacterium]|nr:hypothetical protein [Bacteroidales bacterium]